MKGLPGFLTCVVLLWLGAVLQQALPARLGIFGAIPDFLLLVALTLSHFNRPGPASLIGFTAGLFQGGISGANLVHYVASRVCSSMGLSATVRDSINVTAPVAGLTVAAFTVLARVIVLLLAPDPNITAYLAATIGTAVYNGVIAIPLYALLRRFFRPIES